MELKTLSELNRDFMSERERPGRDARRLSIVPMVIEAKAPYTPRAPKARAGTSGNAVATGGISDPQGNSEFGAPARDAKRGNALRSGRVFAYISNIIFYLAIALIILTVLTSGTDTGMPKTIFGYSYFTVVSHSMQNEIPKGSFILVKSVDSSGLEVGDTITYMQDRNTVTHKIVGIFENYYSGGTRGFQTQGVNNANPDSEIVHSSSIVGKVVFVLPGAGALMAYLSANVYIVFIIFGLCVIISFCIRGILAKPAAKKNKKNN